MKRPACWLLAAASILASSSALAASKTGWDGTWSGAWGGQPDQAGSVTIAGDRVIGFMYQGIWHPVASSTVTAATITYQDQGNVVTFTKLSPTTATATLQTPMGIATALYRRQ